MVHSEERRDEGEGGGGGEREAAEGERDVVVAEMLSAADVAVSVAVAVDVDVDADADVDVDVDVDDVSSAVDGSAAVGDCRACASDGNEPDVAMPVDDVGNTADMVCVSDVDVTDARRDDGAVVTARVNIGACVCVCCVLLFPIHPHICNAASNAPFILSVTCMRALLCARDVAAVSVATSIVCCVAVSVATPYIHRT